MGSYLFSWNFVDIASANVIILIGFIFSIWLLTRTVHEKKLSLTFLNDNLLIFTLTTLIIGRIGAVWFIYPAISEKMFSATGVFDKTLIFIKSFFAFWHGGIEIFWAVGAFLFIFLFLCTLKNEHPLSWLDAFSLPFLLFLIFFSVASFFGGINYGTPVGEETWYSVTYDHMNSVQYSVPVHAVQLYAATLFFILFVIAWKIWGKKIRESWPSGIFGGILISSVFFILSFLEFFRGEVSYLLFDFFPISALILFTFGISIISFMIIRGHFHVLRKFRKIISQ
jgi:hypothetical protein